MGSGIILIRKEPHEGGSIKTGTNPLWFMSQREIARRVGVSRKTVKRYITEYETLAQADPEEGINMQVHPAAQGREVKKA